MPQANAQVPWDANATTKQTIPTSTHQYFDSLFISKCANGNSSSPRKVLRTSGWKKGHHKLSTKRWNSVRQIQNVWSDLDARHQDNVKLRNELLHHASIHNCKSSSVHGWPCSIAWSSFIDGPEISSGMSLDKCTPYFRHSSLFCATTQYFVQWAHNPF